MGMNKQQLFSEDYFDSGKASMGQYASYEAARFYPAFNKMTEFIKRRIAPKRVLDLGCAKGYLVDTLRKNGIEAYGVDISKYAIEQGPEQVRSYLMTCDLNFENLAYPDNYFDCIICMGTLEYIANQQNALEQISRTLTKDGILLMTTLDYIPEGDELRKYAKSKDSWIETFKELGFKTDIDLAEDVFKNYVKMIAEFEIKKALFHSNKDSFKKKVARLLYGLGAKPIMKEYSFYQQKKSGYLMLSFRKRIVPKKFVINEP